MAQGLDHGEIVVDATISTSYVEHAPIEPEAGCLDGWRYWTIAACTQAPVMDQEDTAKVLGLPAGACSDCSCRCRRWIWHKAGCIPAAPSWSGRPENGTALPHGLHTPRIDDIDDKAPPGKDAGRLSADRYGTITGMVFEGDFNTGAYASWGPTVATRVPIHASGPYRVPHYFAEASAIHTNGPVAGAFRGFGCRRPLLQEKLMDRLADAVGLDRLQIRMQNALRTVTERFAVNSFMGSGIAECLMALRQMAGRGRPWRTLTLQISMSNAASALPPAGMVVAILPCPIRPPCASESHRRRAEAHQGATDIGQGANTVITQICADALGINL